ncbi:MAG: ComEC/Rec2 family competence protein [Sphingorhabdus sp.]
MSTAIDVQIPDAIRPDRTRSRALETWLDLERDRLPLLIPVAIGSGIVFWQLFGEHAASLLLALCSGMALLGFSFGRKTAVGRLLLISAFLITAGFAAITLKSHIFGAEPLDRPWTGVLTGVVQNVEHVSARGIVRYRLATGNRQGLPGLIRVNVDRRDALPAIEPGAIIRLKARLMPPAGPALPGGYDFARTAWFDGIGATGRAIGKVEMLVASPSPQDFWGQARNALAARIESSMDKATGPVGSALLVGTRGGISEKDAEALRNSGMAHLLSVSGLHVTAVVGGAYMLFSGLLALWPWLALRIPVPLLAATGSAAVAVGYTLLTGAEVPTVRACVAALLILTAMAMGRQALSLRLLAAAATFVLIVWPEALAGPSFQLSFAAVATIILLHESVWMRRWTARREEALLMRLLRNFGTILLTGIAIEAMLAPIALFHFHKSGLYGALANVVAIPLTTFAIMPAQLMGLIGDQVHSGWGTPFWWIAAKGVAGILWIAHRVSTTPGAIALLPEISIWVFGTVVVCGLIIALFRHRLRYVALVPLTGAIGVMVSSPRPDMLLTGDGQHLAVITDKGNLALLRPGAGEYARSILGETAAIDDEAIALDELDGASCNSDSCTLVLHRGRRSWRILALRSDPMIPAMELAAACARSDIVVSRRRLPWSCKPLWIKADAALLERTGGIAFYLSEPSLSIVAADNAQHSWSAYATHRLERRESERAMKRAAKTILPPQISIKPVDQ